MDRDSVFTVLDRGETRGDAAADLLHERAVRLWTRLGARVQFMDAAAHDALLAWTSHLPQAASTALAGALLRAGIDVDRLGPGGRDATRLAASDPALWTAILLDNADNVTGALQQLAQEIEALCSAVRSRDRDRLFQLLEEGRALHATR
jgi:prephenate dehydrogenase